MHLNDKQLLVNCQSHVNENDSDNYLLNMVDRKDYKYHSISDVIDGEENSRGSNSQPRNKSTYVRNLVAYWFLGLTNNYAYVVMLSAAHDILSTQFHHENKTHVDTNVTDGMNCNSQGTAAILLADILPALLIKSISTFIPAWTHLRIAVSVLLCAASFLITSFSVTYSMSYLGVICASLSSGLGEVTFLGYAALFDKNVISTWSSGTGGAGIFGATSYMALTQIGVSPRNTLLIMLFVPVLMAVCFWIILVHPNGNSCCSPSSNEHNVVGVSVRNLNDNDSLNQQIVEENRAYNLSLRDKWNIVKRIFLPLMLPLAVVYIAEYFINQALMEILYFKNIWLTPSEQYRWYQADYQFGVFLSRSSVNLLTIRKTWILGILQILNVALLLFEVYFRFIPSVWIILFIIFYEGLLGGCSYVNTFYRLTKEMPEDEKEFALSITTVSDSLGIAFSGAIGVPAHHAFCKLKYKTF